MIRVAIDARRLQDHPLGGVGRGLANVIPLLAERAAITLLFDRRRELPEVAGCEAVALPGFGRLPETAWLQVSVPAWLGAQRGPRRFVFHGTYNHVPIAASCPRVVTIHDLSWEHHPEDFPSRLHREAFRAQGRWAAHHCARVVAVSEFVRGLIIETYGVEPSKVVVAPNAADPVFSPERAASATTVLERLRVNGDYVVALGGARRRGLEVALDAWRTATAGMEPRPSLVVVGPKSSDAGSDWSAETAGEDVVFAGRLDDEEWAAVLAGAMAFCYPTRYEGFGMPALEAAASGTPVVCARAASLPEVLGDAAEWAESPSAIHVGEALRRVVEDPARRAKLRCAGLERAALAPTWRDSAEVLLDCFAAAASG